MISLSRDNQGEPAVLRWPYQLASLGSCDDHHNLSLPSILGMPGMTAYVGLLEIGQPKPGETIVVAAASGAVGSVVGQIGKITGCRTVGIAGGAEKCRFVTEELGFDACVDHRAPDFAKQLEAACPNGIDIYFENVGGAVQQTVWPLLNDFARIPVCGLIAQYNATRPMPGPDMFSVLRKRLLLRGFIVWDFAAKEADFLRDVSEWIRTGRLKYREDIVDGLENAPAAFLGLLQGKNFGKSGENRKVSATWRRLLSAGRRHDRWLLIRLAAQNVGSRRLRA
jgi:NADPH-dependent curcumin reductase CurA